MREREEKQRKESASFSVQERLIPELLGLDNHFTASGVVICKGHILLVHHKRLNSWVPPGGHIEAGELPHEAVFREVLEETGVAVEIYSQPMPETEDPEAFFLPAPLCIHAVAAREKAGQFYHLDIAYLCSPEGLSPYDRSSDVELPIITQVDEVHDAAWFKLDNLGDLILAKNVVEIVALVRQRLVI